MKRRLSTLLSLLPFVALVALGYYLLHSNQDTIEPDIRAEQTPADQPGPDTADAPPSMSVLEMEQRRLEELRARLAEATPKADAAPTPDAAVAHIQATQQKLNELEGELGPAPAAPVTGGGDDIVKNALEKQLQNLDTEILEAQSNARQSPDSADAKAQVEALKAQREDLNARIANLATPSTLNEVAGHAGSGTGSMLSEREDVQRRVADLKSDLEYWQSQKDGTGAAAQAARLKKLQDEIQAQEQRVKALENLNPVQ